MAGVVKWIGARVLDLGIIVGRNTTVSIVIMGLYMPLQCFSLVRTPLHTSSLSILDLRNTYFILSPESSPESSFCIDPFYTMSVVICSKIRSSCLQCSEWVVMVPCMGVLCMVGRCKPFLPQRLLCSMCQCCVL